MSTDAKSDVAKIEISVDQIRDVMLQRLSKNYGKYTWLDLSETFGLSQSTDDLKRSLHLAWTTLRYINTETTVAMTMQAVNLLEYIEEKDKQIRDLQKELKLSNELFEHHVQTSQSWGK